MDTNHQNCQNIAPLFSNPEEKAKLISNQNGNDLTYFYAFCKGYVINKQEPNKQRTQDYASGFFIVIHDLPKSRITLFFLKRGK